MTQKNQKTFYFLKDLDDKSGQEILDQIEEGVDFYFNITFNKSVCVFAIKEEFNDVKTFLVKQLFYIQNENGLIEELMGEELTYKKFSTMVEEVSQQYGDFVGYNGHLSNCRIKFIDHKDKVHSIFANERDNYQYYFTDKARNTSEFDMLRELNDPEQDDNFGTINQKYKMALEVRNHAKTAMQKILPNLTVKKKL